jgi:hypothetical protein
VQQYFLLPALILRRELHQQRISPAMHAERWHMYSTLQASTACMSLLEKWRELHYAVASTTGGAMLRGVAAAGPEGEVPYDAILTPMLHEMLQLLMQLLVGVMQATQLAGSSSSNNGSNVTSSGCTSNVTSSSGTSAGASSSGSQGCVRSNTKPHHYTHVPDEPFCLVISLVLPQHAAEYSCCAMHAQQIRLVHVTSAYCW